MGSNFICPQKPQKGDWVRVWRDPLGCETSLWAESLLGSRETKRERSKLSAKISGLRLEDLWSSSCTQGSVPRQRQDNWEWQYQGIGSPQTGSPHLPAKRLLSLLRRSHFAMWGSACHCGNWGGFAGSQPWETFLGWRVSISHMPLGGAADSKAFSVTWRWGFSPTLTLKHDYWLFLFLSIRAARIKKMVAALGNWITRQQEVSEGSLLKDN